MTRDEVLAAYRPIRRAIQEILREAEGACARADFDRAVKQVAPFADPAGLTAEGPAEMITDVALFEPNQRGRRRNIVRWRSGSRAPGSRSSASAASIRAPGAGSRTCWMETAGSG